MLLEVLIVMYSTLCQYRELTVFNTCDSFIKVKHGQVHRSVLNESKSVQYR